MKKGKPSALLPIAVFLVFYLGLGIYSEYILKIPMGFYNIPIVVAFLAAILVACLQNRSVPFEEKLALMGQGIGDKNIITMLLIFLAAGTFVGVVGRSSAESIAYFMLSWIPAKYAVAVLFVVACFVSTAMGTSVGTITLLVPIAAAVAETSGFSLALCVASVMGGSMFGDNLSFISDTTIAACNGQGCEMKDKFRENFWIALPAALAALALILVISFRQAPGTPVVHEYHLLQMVPYLLVLIGGIAGIQVFVVLLIGIASGAVIMLGTGQTTLWDMLSSMGSGTSGMFETCMVAILVAAMCALIRENGGFTVLLRAIHKIFRGKRAASSVSAFSSRCSTLRPQTTPSRSSWQTRSQSRCPRTTASPHGKRHRSSIPSPASHRASCRTARRCSWRFPRCMNWDMSSPPLKSWQTSSIRACCLSVR